MANHDFQPMTVGKKLRTPDLRERVVNNMVVGFL
jgi:hypothetical protein